MECFWSALVARGGKRRPKEDHDALNLIPWRQNLVASDYEEERVVPAGLYLKSPVEFLPAGLELFHIT